MSKRRPKRYRRPSGQRSQNRQATTTQTRFTEEFRRLAQLRFDEPLRCFLPEPEPTSCPVCQSPEYQRVFPTVLIVGITIDGSLPKQPSPYMECRHCGLDNSLFTGTPIAEPLWDLRETRVVENLAYDEFCRRELDLLKDFLSGDDLLLLSQLTTPEDWQHFLDTEYEKARQELDEDEWFESDPLPLRARLLSRCGDLQRRIAPLIE